MAVTLEQIILAQEDIKVMQEETKLRQDALEAMIKAYEEQQEEAEFPKDGDTYYFIDEDGLIDSKKYSEIHAFDQRKFSIGNCFRTKEEAKFAVEQFKVIAEMRGCGGVFNRARNDSICYVIRFEHISLTLSVVNRIGSSEAPIFMFPTEEAARKAIDTIGKERLLKYWFCMEV